MSFQRTPELAARHPEWLTDKEREAPLPITPEIALERISRRGDLFAEGLTLRQSL